MLGSRERVGGTTLLFILPQQTPRGWAYAVSQPPQAALRLVLGRTSPNRLLVYFCDLAARVPKRQLLIQGIYRERSQLLVSSLRHTDSLHTESEFLNIPTQLIYLLCTRQGFPSALLRRKAPMCTPWTSHPSRSCGREIGGLSAHADAKNERITNEVRAAHMDANSALRAASCIMHF